MSSTFIDNDVTARRREIILGRLHGESTDSLATKIGVSRECVFKAYRGLPKRANSKKRKQIVRERPTDDMTICNVCLEYLDGATEEHLMKKYNMSKDELLSCFYAVTDRISCYNMNSQQCYVFGAVVNKRYALNLSLTVMAKECGCSIYTLKAILKGWQPMPIAVAEKLTGILGITVSKLWDDAVVPKTSAMRPNTQNALLQRRAKTYFTNAAQNDFPSEEVKEAVYWVYYRYHKRMGGLCS